MCLRSYVHVSAGACGGQKMVVDPMEFKLKAFVSQLPQILATELGSSTRTVQAFQSHHENILVAMLL